MAKEEEDYEAMLAAQVQEQQEAMAGVDAALEADPSNNELLEMKAQLAEAISEMLGALLALKKDRLLQSLGGGADAVAPPPAQAPAPVATLTPPPPPQKQQIPDYAAPGSCVRFLFTDGRWHFGRVLGLVPSQQPPPQHALQEQHMAGEDQDEHADVAYDPLAGMMLCEVAFTVPTRAWQLTPVTVPVALLRPPRGSGAAAPAAAAAAGAWGKAPQPPLPAVGSRALALLGPNGSGSGAAAAAAGESSRLYQPVEVVAVDRATRSVTVAPSTSHITPGQQSSRGQQPPQRAVVRLDKLELHPYAPHSDLEDYSESDDSYDDDDAYSDSDDGYYENGEGGEDSGDEDIARFDHGGGDAQEVCEEEEEEERVAHMGLGGFSSSYRGGAGAAAPAAGDGAGGARGGGGGRYAGADTMGHAKEAAAAGVQSEVAVFADWESATRGIASKLMAGMGYVRGAGLGREGRGTMAPIDVFLLPQRLGLGGAEPGQAKRVGGAAGGLEAVRKRKRGGKKARQKKEALAAREAKAEERQEEQSSGGLFGFINRSLGDQSDAARVRKAQVSLALPGGPGGGAPAAGGGSGKAGGGGSERQGLMQHQDHVAAVRTKVLRLQEMLQRNKGNKGLTVQIEAQLRGAQSELQAAQAEASRVTKAIRDKEANKKWTKF